MISEDAITSLYLTKRNLENIQEFKGYSNVFLTTDNKEAIEKSDILIFAVQPAHLEKVLLEIKGLLTEKHVIISTITGYSVAKIESVIGLDNFIIRGER